MNKVTLDEIVGSSRYEQMRAEFRRRIIEMKRHRRVAVGDRITFVFENHDTMLFQIQEMVRAEQIVDLDRVRDEVAVYNGLVPNPGELSATMLIEIIELERVREELVRLLGIDEAVRLEIGPAAIDRAARGGGLVIRGEFEPGRSKADKLSAVQYVRFPFTTAARQAFVRGVAAVRLVIDHPRYRHSAPIAGAVRESLSRDLETP